jgi:hypothetical protein
LPARLEAPDYFTELITPSPVPSGDQAAAKTKRSEIITEIVRILQAELAKDNEAMLEFAPATDDLDTKYNALTTKLDDFKPDITAQAEDDVLDKALEKARNGELYTCKD